MPSGSRKALESGFTYIGLLIFMIISGIGLAAIGEVWHTQAQREKETELLFIGEQFRNALQNYYQQTPGEAKQFPATLDELLLDKRFPTEQRYLRKIFFDPMSGKNEWGLIKEQERISGIYSLSKAKPIKQQGFSEKQENFTEAKSYADWKFIAQIGMPQTSSSPNTGENSATPSAARPNAPR